MDIGTSEWGIPESDEFKGSGYKRRAIGSDRGWPISSLQAEKLEKAHMSLA
jgi:hypothetical protein